MVWVTNIVINCIMKNNQQQILSEIKSLMDSIKNQLLELENKIDEYQQIVETHEVAEDSPVEEPAIETLVESVETEPVEDLLDDVMDIELEPSDDLPFYDDFPASESQPEFELVPEPELEITSVPEITSEPEMTPEPKIEDVLEDICEPAVEEFSEFNEKPKDAPMPVIDAMIAKQPWRTDMPGTPVRDIRSAISLNDRILFINYLFGEDPMAFQEMLTQLNAMPSFDEAAAHAIATHPEWDLESDTVYRFMMALRRRHQ